MSASSFGATWRSALRAALMLAFRVALAVALLSGSMAEVRAADDMATASSGGAAITAGSVQPRACQASGMCSLGKTKPFIGEIDDLAALKAALAARSFNNEVILLAETRPVAAASAYQEFRLLGLDNVVVLGGGKPTCSMLSALFPGVGCVWSSATWPRKEDKHYMDRVAFVARTVRLGYNVLLVDSDIMMFHDPYPFLKDPEHLGKTNFMVMRDGNGMVNCGVVYVQNARPDGATAWAMAEIVDRTLRWGERPPPEKPAGARRRPGGCLEQDIYGDVALSIVAGRPLAWGCYGPHGSNEIRRRWDTAHLTLLNAPVQNTIGHAEWLGKAKRQVWPKQLWHDDLRLPVHDWPPAAPTKVPHTRGVWPSDMDGSFFDDGPRGPMSSRWLQLLASDGRPMWPDPENASLAEQAAAITTETFQFLPTWFVQSYSSGGTTGWFSRQLTGDRIPFVMAHLVHVIGGYSNKQNVRRAYEHYHWEVVQQLQAPLHSVGVPFSISTTSHPEPLVLGYTPRLQGECTSTEDDFKAAVVALATAAAVLQRAVAYPYLPCGCPWVTTNGGEGIKQRSLPLNLANSRYLPIESGWSNLTCIWGSYLWAKCVKVHPPHWPGALVPVEVDYYNKLLQKRGKQPVTLQLGAGGAAESVTAEQLREAVRGAGGESAQVLLLDGVVTVTDAPKPITTAIKELMGRNHGEGECFQHVL